MTDPTPDGKFATSSDVTSRFEGTFPSNRLEWVKIRILDVEGELMGKIPSLRKPIADIQADDEAAGDTDRLNRVKRVVCDKVLDLYRNPKGPQTQHSTTTPDVTVSNAWSPDPTRGRIQFTDDELDSARLRKQRQQKFMTIGTSPWMPARSPRQCW